uniref:Uncharacterized protein n=2 Tax=Bursaphelenchus xylophilus TaxID=6326 RepID=A0A1I7SIH4_BURXY
MKLPILVIALISETLAYETIGPRIAEFLFDCPELGKYMPEGVKHAEVFGFEHFSEPHLTNYTFNLERKQWNASEPVRLYPDTGLSKSYWAFFSENFDRIAVTYFGRGGTIFYYWFDAPEQSFEMAGNNKMFQPVFMIGDAVYYWRDDEETLVKNWFLRSRGKPREYEQIYERAWYTPYYSQGNIYQRDVDIMYYLPPKGECMQLFQILTE